MIIHHVTCYRDNVLPICGQLPGTEHVVSSNGQRSATSEFWHAIHPNVRKFLAHAAVGQGSCTLYLEVTEELGAKQA